MRVQGRRPLVEVVAPDRAQSFTLRSFTQARGWDFVWHRHPEWELTLIVAGQGTRFVGDAVTDFTPGGLCLLPPQLPHTWMSRPTGQAGNAVVAQFGAELVYALNLLTEGQAVLDLFRRASAGLIFAPNPELARRFQELAGEPAGLHRLTGLIHLLDALSRLDAAPLAGIGSPIDAAQDRRLGRILRLVEERLADGVAQHEAAAVAKLTPTAFSRWFRRSTGRTFVAHAADRRIAAVCRDLIETDDRIIDVALRWGWNGLAAFNRSFRARKGCSPRAFRTLAAPR